MTHCGVTVVQPHHSVLVQERTEHGLNTLPVLAVESLLNAHVVVAVVLYSGIAEEGTRICKHGLLSHQMHLQCSYFQRGQDLYLFL